tara:strand:- start:420 stop:986 length:567 start_codon:yes stop_codon:yes gene_type:complete
MANGLLRSDRLSESIKRIIKRNPESEPLFRNLNLVWGNPKSLKGNYAEYFPANEPGAPGSPNPYFGMDTLAVNPDRATSNERLDEIVLGDAMHRMPKTFPSLYGQFTNNQSPGYERKMRERHKRTGDSRPYDQWLKSSGHDAMIRGAVLSDMPQHRSQNWGGLINRFPFSKQQHMALKGIKQKLRKTP